MILKIKGLCFLIILILACFHGTCSAQQSCIWGGAENPNMVSTAQTLPADLSDLTPVFERMLGTHQYSIPSLRNGRIFLGINDRRYQRVGVKPTNGGLLMCLDCMTGEPIWQLPCPRYFEGVIPPFHFNQWKCGICSGPTVEKDRLYVVGSRGEILCLDVAGQANGNDGPFQDELAYMNAAPGTVLNKHDGDIIWMFDLKKELDIVLHDVCGSTVLIYGDFLYACTSNGIDDKHQKVPRPMAPSVIVLDKKTGVMVAQDDEKIASRMLHGHWSSPFCGMVDGKAIIFFGGGDGILYAFEPFTGKTNAHGVQALKKIWSQDCNPPEYRFRNGKPIPYSRWNRKSPEGPSEIIGTPVCHGNRVYVTIGQSPIHGPGKGQLSCLNAASGKVMWTAKSVNRSLCTPAIHEGLVYVSDFSGLLHCFDAENGRCYWVHDMGAGTWSASPFVADGKIYAGNQANILWILKTGKEKKVLSKNRLKSMPITPVAMDGILYVPTQKRLIAFPGK